MGLVFSILLILSFTFYASLEKESGSRRLGATYVGHCNANRKLLAATERELYNSFSYIPDPNEMPSEKKTTPSEEDELQPKFPKVNPECARLNLWPLVQEGREAQPLLYNSAVALLKTFYGKALLKEKATPFLDAFLKGISDAVAKETPFALEKLRFKDPTFQKLYYRMLKGTKECDLATGIGYPCVLDYIKIEPLTHLLCLYHAHPYLIAPFFGLKVAFKLYEQVHAKGGPLLTQELIEQLSSEERLFLANKEIFTLFEFGNPQHEKIPPTTLVEEDSETHISLRKTIHFERR